MEKSQSHDACFAGMTRSCYRWCRGPCFTSQKRFLALEAVVFVVGLTSICYILRGSIYSVPLPLLLPERPGRMQCSEARQSPNTSASSLPSSLQCLRERDSLPKPVLPGDSSLPYPSCIVDKEAQYSLKLFPEPREHPANDTCLKKILFWNDDHSGNQYGFGFGHEPFLAAGCRVNTCFATTNRTRYPVEELDALVWDYRSLDRSLPQYRSPHTRYVFVMMESASYLYGDLRDYTNVFNWTFTYRLDSDIPAPYDRVFRRRQPLPPSNRNYAAGKSKLVAWFVSHCEPVSGRKRMVETLQQWVPVDIYGKCGPLTCENSQRCYEMLNATYKFYLAFENSLCRDYITEKLFNVLKLDVVPVVFGLGNYSAHAPPHSYIDALSFPSVSALADYLRYLEHNDTAYNEYFRWKRFHQQFSEWALVSQQFCALCEMLHSDAPAKTYDLHTWYKEGGHCKTQDSPDIHHFINSGFRIKTLSIQWCITAYVVLNYLL